MDITFAFKANYFKKYVDAKKSNFRWVDIGRLGIGI